MLNKKKIIGASLAIALSATIPIRAIVSNNMEPTNQTEPTPELVEPEIVEEQVVPEQQESVPVASQEQTSTPTQPEPETPPEAPDTTQLHRGWMQDAGIAEADYDSVEEMISLISNWNVNAQSANDGYGLGKLPRRLWNQMGCTITENPVDHLACLNKYITLRYGSWGPALNRQKNSGSY